jgi:uncharacterized protein
MHLRLILLLALLLGAMAPVGPVIAQEFPILTTHVTDQVGLLNEATRIDLDQQLQALEDSKGSQLVLLIVATTAPHSLFDYSFGVVEANQVGRLDVDDGVLLLVATEDRKMRIEVGYGLEGAIPDVHAKRIIDEYITPLFRTGDFAGGIKNGVNRLITSIDGEPLPEPTDYSSPEDNIEGLFILFVVSMVVGPIVCAALGRLPGSAGTGIVGGAIAYAIANTALVGGFLGFVIFIFLVGGGPGGKGRSYRNGSGRSGGIGGGFGRSGGFGGGGGSFGGGGASGGW